MTLNNILIEHIEDIKSDPNALGEILRKWAFVGPGYGCYSTFELRPEFVEIVAGSREFEMLWGRKFDPNDNDENSWGYCDVEAIKEITWFIHPSGIEVGWHWGGDGFLAFYIPELNKAINNHDCKKDNEWDFYPESED